MLPSTLRSVAALGHVAFASRDWDLNLVVQRGPAARAGAEDDLFTVSYLDGGLWVERSYPCSADPGLKALREVKNQLGVPRIAFGQYRGAYAIGMHRGRRALVQVGPVTVERDRDGDADHEGGPRYTGLFGINIHDDAGVGAEASEGCVVMPKRFMEAVLGICDQSVGAGFPNRFTLTVIPA